MIRYFFGLLTLLALLAQAPLATAGSLPAPLNGQWKGPLKMVGGRIMVIITIVPLTNGTYYGALDAPQQRINRMPVEVELHGTDLKLRIEQAGSSFTGKVLGNGAELSGTWTQPGLKSPMVLQRAAAKPMAAHFPMAPPYRETKVTFQNTVSQHHLGGILTVPAGSGPFPAVALLSDVGAQDRDVEVAGYRMFGQLADYLTRHGIAVLRFDDRGVGQSSGSHTNSTTADLVTDAQAAISFLRSRPLIAPQHVGLLGHGEGANVALLTAAKSGPAPAFVVSLAAYGQSGYQVLLRQQGEIMRLIGADPGQVKAARDLYARTVNIIRQTPNNALAQTRVASLLSSANTGIDESMARARAAQLTSPWSRFFFDFDPQTHLAKVRCPVLLLNGTADLQVSAKKNMTPLRRTLHNAHRNVTSYRLNGVNHLFQPAPNQWPMVNGVQQPTFSPDALKRINDWVAVTTQRPKTPLGAPSKQPGLPRKLVKVATVVDVR
ncbi:alpha/beta fold hydrolase [Hymenobacter sp. BT664]|uniref:Alpha/beta fold hydrolase n=1 Tax=Hymenobacter montanus TaxID=2771359 RepID=A0A927BDD7_9BACT|nr:alpha/beta fold hydrolase [Hymenobacter montanus]MBD2768756.1 alpha/beta fold hydrolase [Hymenobacter montanus]